MRPADARDAGSFGPLRPNCAQLMLMMLAVRGLCVNCAQLMLMMLAVWVFASRVRATDASKVQPADADDAGGAGSLRPKCAQLMLMMLAVWGLCVQSAPS